MLAVSNFSLQARKFLWVIEELSLNNKVLNEPLHETQYRAAARQNFGSGGPFKGSAS